MIRRIVEYIEDSFETLDYKYFGLYVGGRSKLPYSLQTQDFGECLLRIL